MGFIEPLCNDCVCPDCTNSIKETTVSVMGVPRTLRLYVINNVYRQVVACNGYLGKKYVAKSIADEQQVITIPTTVRDYSASKQDQTEQTDS